MKGNRDLDELLIAYVLKELNAEDESYVIEYINSDERNKRHFEELQNTWKAIGIKKELEKINVNQEWEHFGKAIVREKKGLIAVKPVLGAASVAGELTVEEKVAEVRTDEDKIPEEEKAGFEKRSSGSRVRKISLSVAVAASVAAVIVSGWFFLRGKEQASIAGSASKTEKPEGVASLLKQEINTSGKAKKIMLPDGSEVVLADKSEISYQQPFTNDRRDITLKGKADFKVASDKTKAFTVYSLDLATTALGTQFTVSAFERSENTIIRLNEGKVVVRPASPEKMKSAREYFLLPGQALIYNRRNYLARLVDYNLRNMASRNDTKRENAADSPDLPENNKGSWYMFNNQSLEQVFDQLKLLYNTEIVYSKRDVHNLYFIGKFDKADSLYTILNQIASLNDLKVSKKNNKFIISK